MDILDYVTPDPKVMEAYNQAIKDGVIKEGDKFDMTVICDFSTGKSKIVVSKRD